MELFKKGQLIPKRIGGLHVHRKARHRLTFGCDVQIDGNNWIAVPDTGIAMVLCKKSVSYTHLTLPTTSRV